MSNRQIRELADALLKDRMIASGANVRMLWARVTATHTGPNTIDIQLFGSTVVVTGVRYSAAYTPSSNDIVYGRIVGTDMLVEGKLA